ncbi:FG-GAP repeat protein, partial [bacterium]|nr:FG-GAP repeat protein [bacterium]
MKRIVLITLVVILSAFVITADAYAAPNRSPKPSHDVAVANISAPSSYIQGDTVPVVVTVKNQGNCDESFIVTLTDVTNDLKIGSQSVTLSTAGEGGMDETCDLTLTGPTKPGPNEPYTQYGNYLRFGDVNGDGYDDLLVAGASRYNQCQGRAYLYYGGQDMDEKADNTFTGEAIDNYFGEGAALVDVNGDGFDDVILGAWKYNNAQGRVYIYHGSPDMDENADLILDGRERTNDRFGNKICAGDVNNDGYDDVFVNALGWNKRTGRVYLYYGGDPMDTTADLIFNGENEGDLFGCDIDDPKMIGDVNGDGYGDLLISTRFWNYLEVTSKQGRAYLYYGGEGTSMDSIPDKVFTGENR